MCLDLFALLLLSTNATVPSSPSGVSVRPQYTVDGSIQYVDVGFTEVVSIMVPLPLIMYVDRHSCIVYVLVMNQIC